MEENPVNNRICAKEIVRNWFKEESVKKGIKIIVAREGLVIIILGLIGIVTGLVNYFVTDGRIDPFLSTINVSLILYAIHWIVRFIIWAIKVLKD